MTVVENKEENRTKLSLWRNAANQVFIEMTADCAEPDPYDYQYMAVCLEDAKALAAEIQRIVNEIELDKNEPNRTTEARPEANGTSLPLFGKADK